MEGLATTLENVAEEGNMKQIYVSTKEQAEIYSELERPVRVRERKR